VVSVWFDGVDELNTIAADLGKAGFRAGPLAQVAIAKTAADIEADAKAFVPVDTGNLRNSIGRDVHGLTAEIGPTANYGGFVEWGTSRMAPRAYMGPAFDRRAPGLKEAFTRIAERTLDG
jgi:HK97 gp10 family phage protein